MDFIWRKLSEEFAKSSWPHNQKNTFCDTHNYFIFYAFEISPEIWDFETHFGICFLDKRNIEIFLTHDLSARLLSLSQTLTPNVVWFIWIVLQFVIFVQLYGGKLLCFVFVLLGPFMMTCKCLFVYFLILRKIIVNMNTQKVAIFK